MVDLKISMRSKGEEELQYLREGLLRQLLLMVELKSEGGCKLLRSSTTEAERIRGGEIETREKKEKKRRTKVEEEMEMEEGI